MSDKCLVCYEPIAGEPIVWVEKEDHVFDCIHLRCDKTPQPCKDHWVSVLWMIPYCLFMECFVVIPRELWRWMRGRG